MRELPFADNNKNNCISAVERGLTATIKTKTICVCFSR